jgi:hypothetical protein
MPVSQFARPAACLEPFVRFYIPRDVRILGATVIHHIPAQGTRNQMADAPPLAGPPVKSVISATRLSSPNMLFCGAIAWQVATKLPVALSIAAFNTRRGRRSKGRHRLRSSGF